MNERWSQIYRVLLLAGDFFVLVLAFSIAYVLRVDINHSPLASQISARTYLEIFLSLLPFWLIIFAFLGLYTKPVYENRLSQSSRIFLGSIIGILTVIGFQYFDERTIFPAHIVPVYATLISFILLVLEREVLRMVRTTVFRYGWGVNRVMMIGNADETRELALMLADSRKTGYRVVAIVGRKSSVPQGLQDVIHMTSIPQSLKELERLGIDTIIQTEWYENSETNTTILETAQQRHIAYRFIPSQSEFYTNSNTVELFHGLPAVSVRPTPLNGWGRIAKRVFDVIISTLAIIILSPIFLLIALIIKITDPGPIFYTQRRVTRFGDEFNFYKFRSMKKEYGPIPAIEAFKKMHREDLITEFEKYRKVPNDPRVTWVGKIIRKTSMDELPNLWNVLKGDMSLVGPRPFMVEELKLYKTSPLLFSVRTGITGLWQVSGRNDLTFEKRLELELYYVQNWSFWMDIRILFRTIKVVFIRRGAQ
jgi:exopolysaccharide biosynthesis polyprenyl glycosylphosphotransferase